MPRRCCLSAAGGGLRPAGRVPQPVDHICRKCKATLLGVCQEYLKAEKYETAVLLSKSLVHLMPKDQALQLTAQIYRTWGDNLMEQAEHLPPERAESLRKQARTPVPPGRRHA